MGCGNSKVEDTPTSLKTGTNVVNTTENSRPQTPMPKESVKTIEIDEEYNEHSTIRLLLLGAAESGKTTLLEQIRLLYKQNYSETELFHRKAFIFNNILQSIRSLIMMMQQTNTQYQNVTNKAESALILEEEENHYSCFNEAMLAAIKSVWNDGAVQKLYVSRSTINLNDSAKYFLDDIDRINKLDFTPTPKDLIMSYVPTVGIQNVIFQTNKRSFQLFDIGGQRIDRRKWATMYDGIDAIFFCLAISEYDQMMTEDMSTNRLTDSLQLLSKISEEKKFSQVPLFLFLNETDVFLEKLPHFPLQDFIPEYNGSSPDDALDFIEQRAREVVSTRDDKLLFVYRITCIETDSMSKILATVFKTILSNS